ncbi:zinc finger, C3HC4 type (RING finger) protein (macronuclear) [Tetrahymena thermophila SB210]|uniref:RING-type E3 ubiquitin transferase n=1 Tax=Tetrahymena thermophila (strain SB210) TaxID=312017 RepID=I7M9I9_TETTS|nr:zinc finger, C3HC4 type (RING finger) protein [Tetrahymena thermophila SB210]EAS01841.3 zinc finger, C3HC4 type (RING finger) protein [Tetrahymena thermophila SB210]|eukprot:XP_001022086.3 zinc finger, C3HC4 type (RING finger) protein [Tetrahymena thermophila SB210]
MNPGAFNLNDYQQEQMAQQRKKKMLILFIALSSLYVFSRTSVQTSQQNQLRGNSRNKQYNEENMGLIDDSTKALKQLEDSESTIDGYKELYRAFYERYEDEQNGIENPTPDLKGNSASDLLFGTLYSLKRKQFEGVWNSENSQNILGFLDNKQGHFNSYIESYNKSEIRFYVAIRDDQYIDHKSMIGLMIIKRGTNFTIVDKQVKFSNLTLMYNLQNDLQYISNNYHNATIPVNMVIQFNEQTDSEKYINKYSPYLFIKISNENTDDKFSSINISAEADLEDESSQKGRQTMYYAIFLTIVLSIQFIFVIKMMKSFLVQDNEEQKFSLLSLSIVFIWDGFFCFLHLLFAISQDHQFHYFITPCFLYMILWNIFERGLITIVWRNRHANIVDEQILNKKRICFFVCLYSALIFSFFIIKQYRAKSWLLYLVNLYFVPQIIRNVRRGQQVKVCKSYVFGFMMIRSLILLYYRGCPENIAKLSPQYSTCIGIVVIIIAQVLFLYAQEYFGPRFFIPKRFQTDCYDYYYKLPHSQVDLESQGQADECTICITELSMQPVLQSNSSYFKDLIIKAKQKQNYIMKTPCDHKYHIPCLLKWMEVKMECPTCRAPLPPMV